MDGSNPFAQFGYDDGSGSAPASASSGADPGERSITVTPHAPVASPAAPVADGSGNPFAKFGYDDGSGQAGSAPVPTTPHAGPLANDASGDSWFGSAAKGAATAVVKGLGDIPGFAGNLHDTVDYLHDYVGSKFTGETPEAYGARHKAAYEAAQEDARNQPGIFGAISRAAQSVPDAPDGKTFSDPVLSQTGEYVPQTGVGRVGMAGVEAGVGAIGPGMGVPGGGASTAVLQAAAPAVAKAVVPAIPALAASGAVGQGVGDATGSPIAGMIAGGVVPVGAHVVGEGVRAGVGRAADFVAPMDGTGPFNKPKPVMLSDGSVATDSQGQPIMATGAQQRLAGQTIHNAASDPEAVRANLLVDRQGPEAPDIVPRSKLTTFQKTGDTGLGQAERQAARNPGMKGAFIQRDAEQNAARVAHLGSIQADGSPVDVAQGFRAMRDAMDADHAAALDKAQTGAAAARDAIPGANANPEALGAALRDPLSAARAAAKKQENALWSAVPKDMIVPAAPITKAVETIRSEMSPSARPLEGEESRLLDVAGKYGDHTPFADIKDLRSDVSAEMRKARIAGDTQTVRRLTILRGAIEDSIDHAVENQVSLDQIAARRGIIQPEEATGSRIVGWIDAYGDQRNEGFAVGGGGVGSGGRGKAPTSAGAPGAARAPGVGSRGDANAQGVSAPAGKEPQSLVAFLRSNGGIKEFGGELGARELHKQFAGLVNNKTGLSLDYAREAAAQAGYLGADTDHAVRNTDVNDLLHAIDNHPVYSVHDEARVADRSDRANFLDTQRAYKSAANEIRSSLDAVGHPSAGVDKELIHDASVLMVHNRLPWDEALERANTEGLASRQEAAREAQSRASQEQRYNEPSSGDAGERSGEEGHAQPGRGSVGNVGDARFEEGFPLDAASGALLKTASDFSKDRFNTFDNPKTAGVVAKVLKPGATAGVYDRSVALAPSDIFHKGPTGGEDVRAYLKAGGSPEALNEAASASLRQFALKDGVFDQNRVATWIKDHAQAAKELPADLRDKFINTIRAQRTVDETIAAQSARETEFKKGAVAPYLGLTEPSSVVKQVGAIFGSKAAPETMAELVAKTKDNPAAADGLRRAVVEHIQNKFLGNEAGTSGQAQIRSQKFIDFLRDPGNRAALGKVFTTEEIGKMSAVTQDLERAQRSVAGSKLKGGSNTPQDLVLAAKANEGRSIIGRLAFEAGVGVAGGFAGGPITGAATWLGTRVLGELRQAGITRVGQLATEAMLNPDLARALLEKAPMIPDRGVAARIGLIARQSAATQTQSQGRQQRERDHK